MIAVIGLRDVNEGDLSRFKYRYDNFTFIGFLSVTDF